MKILVASIISILFFSCKVNESIDTPTITSQYQIFYLGVQHKIMLTGVDKIDSTSIKTNSGQIEYMGKNRFAFTPNKIGPSDFFIYNKNNEIKQHFIVTKTPDPIPAIIHLEKNYSDTNRIRTYKEFEPYEVMASIFYLGHTESFKLNIVRNDSLVFNHTNIGGQFDDVLKRQISSLKSKDILIFSNWAINAPEGLRIIKDEYKITID